MAQHITTIQLTEHFGMQETIVNEPYPKLYHKQENGHLRGTFVIFVWATIGQNFLSCHNSTENEDIVL